ncbi:MAG TPA: hypothetical protein VGM46_02515 [Mesorhizobium sp.]|jgi:hypothetical protein
MTAFRYLFVALVPLVLAGCISDEDQRQMDQEKCDSYGFRPGSNSFASCMMKQNERRADDEQRYLDRSRADEQRKRDRRRSEKQSSYIDPTPQYDRDGNPNFDTKGGYIGCNGIGCTIDNPDDDN